MLRGSNTNNLEYRYTNGTAVQYVYFPDFFLNLSNQYIHITITCDYNNKKIKVYRNGVQFGATQNLTGVPMFPSINRAKYIGAYNSSNYKITDGSLDEVRIYNRGLSADEITEIYNKTKNKY